ncbi:uncharacterized protein [Gossypium hirsutum]|uniref:Uncharacterized protein n=1 Tax=Gossypium hirsutum TaxID=3635 RepID=A0A1U8NML6_GOSHI|nr:uncharacterized protein LOC107949859 [Gossypium hirsutum]
MSNLAKLEFAALDISGKKYLSWVLDAEIHLDAKGLGNTIVANEEASNQDKAKAMIFIRYHLHEGLKVEYLTVKDPLKLWKKLNERFDHQKMMILPKARHDWMHLRLQIFKTVSEYNSELFKISSQLKLCRENITDKDLLEKTFSTFHATNVPLQQKYLAEQNNELLVKNHGIRPTGTAPLSEVNVAVHNKYENEKYKGRDRGRGRSGGHGRGRTSNCYHGVHNSGISDHQKKNNNEG